MFHFVLAVLCGSRCEFTLIGVLGHGDSEKAHYRNNPDQKDHHGDHHFDQRQTALFMESHSSTHGGVALAEYFKFRICPVIFTDTA